MRRSLRAYRSGWWRERRIWEIASPDEQTVQHLRERLRLSSLLAKVLCGRGMTSVETARQFLLAGAKDLPEPESLMGVSAAADLIVHALRNGKAILVHGDYDTDGICATALLAGTLARFGGRVFYFAPNRHRHGYGVADEAIHAAKRQGVGVIITVDCGITARRQIAEAKDAGITTIVLDHHEPPETLPPAHAIVNPKLPDCRYPCPDLCATALAFKVAQVVAERLKRPAMPTDLPIELVALATVTDVMPLVGENRLLVREGLQALRQRRHLGLRTLMEIAGVDARSVRSFHLGFILGPRLNAAGRMDDPKPALQLLLTTNPNEARELAQRLDSANRRRQREEETVLRMAVTMVEQELDLTTERVIVLASPEWHPGVIGIVAARLVDLYSRPVFLIALQDGIGHGSARSIPNFSIADALKACQPLLLSGGGHKSAGGFKIVCEQLPAFRERLNELAERWLSPDDLCRRTVIDAEVEAEELTLPAVQELALLEPLGYGNPKPVFLLRDAKVIHAQRYGERLVLRVRKGERVLELQGDGMGEAVTDLPTDIPIHVCFTAELRTFNGLPMAEWQIVDWCPKGSELVVFRFPSPQSGSKTVPTKH